MSNTYDPRMPSMGQLSPKLIAIGVVTLLVVALAASSIAIVGPGERGVVFSQISGIRDILLSEGLHFRVPFVETVILIDVKVQKVQTEASASSKDLQVVETAVAVNFHVDPASAQKLYQEVGLSFKDRIVDPAIQESVKAIAAGFTAEELITRRAEVKNKIKADLAKRLIVFNLIVDEFSIVNFSFSQQFNAAIEAKQAAEQAALTAKRDLERIKIEAEQRITQAEAESKAQQLQKETLTPILLQLRAIEKWDGKLPQVSGGATPFINVDAMSK